MEGWYAYSEQRRNDPEIRAAVARIVKGRREALAKAAELLAEAEGVLAEWARFDDDSIYDRQVRAVRLASMSLADDARFVGREKTEAQCETYIGNLAAGPLGEQLEKVRDAWGRA